MTYSANNQQIPPSDDTEFHLLLALSSGGRNESELMRQVKNDTSGNVVLGPGTLRGKLALVIAAGLVTYTSMAGLSTMNRVQYRLTEKGKAVLMSEVEAQTNTNQTPGGFTV